MKSVVDSRRLKVGSVAVAICAAVAIVSIRAENLQQSGWNLLQVRIGLHTSEPIQDVGDFYGKQVNFASRIADWPIPPS